MSYHIVAENVSLDDLQQRIQDTDLVPSRTSLLETLSRNISLLKQQGISSLATLRQELKTAKRREALSTATEIDIDYLVLLRREVESYFPKPKRLTDFHWLPVEEVTKLTDQGIRNTADLYEATASSANQAELIKSTGIDDAVLQELIHASDLSRIQWVSPTFARMLTEAEYVNASQIAGADPDELCVAIESINEEQQYFKGKIGLRDVKRLIQAAGYVPMSG